MPKKIEATVTTSVSDEPRAVVITLHIPGVDPIAAPLNRARFEELLRDLMLAGALAWPMTLPGLPGLPQPRPTHEPPGERQ
jgi:hypothetical protein